MCVGVSGIECVDPRDAANHPKMCRTVFMTKNVNNAETKTSCLTDRKPFCNKET